MSVQGHTKESALELGSDISHVNLAGESHASLHGADDAPPAKGAKKWFSRKKKEAEAAPAEVEPATPEEPEEKVSFFQVYQFADKLDWTMLAIGTVANAAAGAAFPLMGTFMGDTMNAFYPKYNEKKVVDSALNFFYLALGLLVVTYIGSATFGTTAARQTRKIRSHSLEATLRQEVGWFDTSNPNELASRIAGDTVVIEEGMGQKLSELIKYVCQFLSGFIIGFTKGWKLTLAMCAALPCLAITFGFLGFFMQKFMAETQMRYAKAGGVAEETFGSMRTVAALRAEKAQSKRFADYVLAAQQNAIKGGVTMSFALGAAFMVIFLTYALGWWYGGYLISHNDPDVRTVGDVTNVFFSVMMGSMAMAQVGPNLTAVFQAQGAMQSIMRILHRVPKIGADKDAGIEKTKLAGNMSFKDIFFTYPSRPDAPILQGFSLEIKSGQTVALVGASGSGKSTVISLLERFYDPDSGIVEIDGIDTRNYKLSWLRSQMGLVGQEPVLFQGTIAENIAWGVGDINSVTMDEIIAAAQKANAHKFIMQFPDGYDTYCGEKGAQLSGGQKQRIAIARAIIRAPSIMLLDEATSALDTESERIVQSALDKLLEDKERTCIVVAHRLTTIRNADLIVVFQEGKVVEQGTHDELIAKDGAYANLVRIQMGKPEEEVDAAEEERKVLEQLRARQSSKVSTKEHSIKETMAARLSRKKSEAGTSRHSVYSLDKMAPRLSIASQKAGELGMMFTGETEEGGDVEAPAELKGIALQRRIFALNKPFRAWFFAGLVCSLIAGMIFPAFSLLITEMMTTLGIILDKDKLYKEVCQYAIWFTLYGVGAGLIMAGMVGGFSIIGEKMTTVLREKTFENTVRQDIAFFDSEENSTGALTARLSTEAALVKSVAGENQGRQVQNVSTLVTGLVIAFALGSWQVTLVLLCLFPLLVGLSAAQMKFIGQGQVQAQVSVAESGKLATEAISNVRTVKSFGLEDRVYERYFESLQVSEREGVRKANFGGLASGGTFFIMFGGYALVFWYGGTLVGKGSITFDQCLKSLMAIMMSAMGMAQTSAFMTDQKSAIAAAQKIFAVEDRHPVIDAVGEDGLRPGVANGDIEVKDIVFRYPSRPNQTILDGYSLKIKAGQTVALVGESGSGKSTMISLVERFYDPINGTVYLDGRDLKTLNVGWLRDQIGLVGQEPVLFSGSIADNIGMGKPGATLAEIEEAAKMANAHNFIVEFPDGYNTEVGERGAQLSGGQKQRISIARAIIKNPAVLLLDEATSALDAESERVVQEALDKLLASKKRTTLVVAHRLSTIQNADVIAVHKGGKVVELGKHEELMKLNGEYAKLNKLQVRA